MFEKIAQRRFNKAIEEILQERYPLTETEKFVIENFFLSKNVSRKVAMLIDAKKNNEFEEKVSVYLNGFSLATTPRFYSDYTHYSKHYLGDPQKWNQICPNGKNFLQTSMTKVCPNAKDLLSVWQTLTNLPEIFSNRDLEIFSNQYIKSLYARKNPPNPPFQQTGTKKPDFHYKAIKGMYCFDAQILHKMSLDLVRRNLNLIDINNAITNLDFEADISFYVKVIKQYKEREDAKPRPRKIQVYQLDKTWQKQTFENEVLQIREIIKNPEIIKNQNHNLSIKQKLKNLFTTSFEM